MKQGMKQVMAGKLAYQTSGVGLANDICVASRCVIMSVVLLSMCVLDSCESQSCLYVGREKSMWFSHSVGPYFKIPSLLDLLK